MLDLFSGGRIISGFVRGTGMESLAHNVNTMYNRERFQEAHDLIIKTWTQPGPFSWHGKHYEYRVVNPWVLPLQKPHPRVMVPGVVSTETVRWTAEHNYPYIALATLHDETEKIFGLYDSVAREAGHEVTEDNHGYLVRVHVAETDELAHEQARKIFTRREAQVTSHNNAEAQQSKILAWNAPPGYMTRDATRRFYKALAGGSPYSFYTAKYDDAVAIDQLVVGGPERVAERLDLLRRRHTLGHIVIWHFPTEDDEMTRTNIRLLGDQVLPRLRDMAKKLAVAS
jgi:alkanesulfonate monooxygenase SsuD/methylene tetrahydromethanopterin reductase-like flavin-dependent oxidoreductase (luciferase family)